MTIEDTLKKMLTERGMFPEQSSAVLSRVKANPANEPMAGRWQDDAEGYPKEIMLLAWYSTKTEALAFIDETCPRAWFRPMFLPAE